MWTVYNRPTDYPESYVARRFEIRPEGPTPTNDVVRSGDVEVIRRFLALHGLTCLSRRDDDEPHIMETWV